MNREIKFRGLTVNGTWDYGDFVHGDYESGRCYLFNNSINFLERFHEVIPKTVGQYTGLKDKNGKEIYEGDILLIGEKRREVEVIFKDGGFGFMYNGTCVSFRNQSPEVIGNIYESEVTNAKD